MARNKALELSIRIAGKMDKSLLASIHSAQKSISGFSQNVSRMGTIGLSAIGAAAAGAAAAIVSCTKEAQGFESSMADVVKYVDGLADANGKISTNVAGNGKTFVENYGEMKQALLDLSTRIPMTKEELTQLAAAAGQSGKGISDLIQYDSKGNISGFLKDAAMMGTAMDISADLAGDYAAKWEKSFNMTHDEVMVLADQINYLGANSATTAAEIAGVVNDAASLGQIGGLQVSTTAALADAVLAMGVDSGKAATSISRMITNMSLGTSATDAQKAAWESLGFTAEGVARSMQNDSISTMKEVFTAIGNIDADKQVATLKTLFGQWAIQGAAKLTGNLDTFVDALNMVSDPSQFNGSMEREFVIKAGTSESIDKMLGNTLSALKVDIGDNFLPVKKELSTMLIDLMNTIRDDLPQISQLAQSLAALLSSGVKKAGDAFKNNLPHIQKFLDCLVNNGEKILPFIGTLTAGFSAMKLAPGISSLLGSGGLFSGGGSKGGGGIFGMLAGLFKGGQNAAGSAKTYASNVRSGISAGASGVNGGFFSKLANGAVGAFATMQNMDGLASGKARQIQAAKSQIGTTIMDAKLNGAGGVLKNMFSQTKAGGLAGGIENYFSGIGDSIGEFMSTGIMKGVSSIPGIGKEILSGISQRTGLTAGAQKAVGMAKGAGSWVAGKASGAIHAIGASAPVQTVKAAGGKALGAAGGFSKKLFGLMGAGMGQLGNLGGAGAGVLGSILGPVASGFGSLFSGALPVVGVVSSIIAVVSILGDHLEDIRNIVGSVFGAQGLAVFDAFTARLSGIGEFITGLFSDGGVAAALAPVQNAITNMFGEDAGAAFSGLTGILQSVMGVVGQIVNFANTTVKPIIEDVFNFITSTAMPAILNVFTEAAPHISGIIDGIGSAVMTGMQIIGDAIQFVMPAVQGFATFFMNVGQVYIPALLSGIHSFSQSISNVMSSLQQAFQGLITFITGVFSGSWSQAWQGIKDIFGGAFNALVELCKAPVNAVISIINSAISGINGLGLTIPDWVPFIGGNSFRINLPTIPMLAKGGFTNGPSLAGEAGREAVISFQSGVRGENINTWMQAGRMLGVSSQQAAMAAPGRQLAELESGGEGWGGNSTVTFTFAPEITIQGNASRDMLDSALADAIAGVLAQRREEINRLAIYPNVSRLDEELLDILAGDFKVDWWDSDYSLEEKRRTLASSWQVHKTLGTKAAVETALQAIYPATQVKEWFEYGARPYHFKLHINVTDDELDSAKQKRVLARLEYYKNLRSHLDGITYFLQAVPAHAYAGTAMFGTYQREGASLPLPGSVGWPSLHAGVKAGAVYLGEQRRVTAQLPPVELSWPKSTSRVSTGAAIIRMYEKIQTKGT